MKRAFLPLCLLAAALASGHAQVQEDGLRARLGAKWDMSEVNPMQNKSYGGSEFDTKTFSTATYGGTKSASIKTFATHSFLGVKNPWFGKTVYETSANREASRTATESGEQYKTAAYAVSEYAKGGKKDLIDGDAVLPNVAKPRPYLVEPKAKGVMDRFTENLQTDLSIDDVRELLNKGAAKK